MAIDTWVRAQDGLKLHVREWGPRTAEALPVVCLPGLSRNGADFEPLATGLTAKGKTPRRVVALDSRGRGKSEYDRKAANYTLEVELADLLAVLTALEIGTAVFVGTSRGGILIMQLGAARPTAVTGCVLNDIGPVIEPEGLARIKGYVGKLPQPVSFKDGAVILRKLFGSQFTALQESDWLAFARRTFRKEGDRMVPNYDVRLATILQDVDLERPLLALWKEFDSLARVPMLVVRGGNSDILSVATVEAMSRRRASLERVTVADQGHAPLLADSATIGRIAGFIRKCEARG